MISTALADEIEEKMRPVGQVVKTEASHAFNIGSNPVRVTIPHTFQTRFLIWEKEELTATNRSGKMKLLRAEKLLT